MALNATLPWADSRHYVTCMDGISIERPNDGADIKPWETQALSFETKVYVHTQPFSPTPVGGVEEHSIYVILSKSSVRAKKWRIDSIDSASMSAYENARNNGDISSAIFRAVAAEMWRRGLDPTEIIGWRRYTQNRSYKDILEWVMECK